MSKKKLVVIGNGMAPGKALETLIDLAPDAYDITIFNAEPRVNYNRIMLSPLLSGESTFEDIIIHGDGWYINNGITLYKGHKVTKIDRVVKTVTSEAGVTASYDKLLIATGSTPFIIPVPGHKLAGVAAAPCAASPHDKIDASHDAIADIEELPAGLVNGYRQHQGLLYHDFSQDEVSPWQATFGARM